MSLLQRIAEANRRISGRRYYRYYVNDLPVGFIDADFAPALPAALFVPSPRQQRIDSHFSADERLSFEQSVEQFFRTYFRQQQLTGWRDERYPVKQAFTDDALFLIERAALSYLGITGYGVHVNGYVQTPAGIQLWIAKRSKHKPTSPGKLDQLAAGGLPYGISPKDNVIKECEEEASIPHHLATRAVPVSAITYRYDLAVGLRPDVAFVYDLCLPPDFVPRVNDDEVESFALLPIDEVLTHLANTQDFKFNSAVVLIDFAIRHGVITPEHPDYLALCAGCMRGDRID